MQRHGGKAVVASFGAVPEAEIAAAALRANGFEAIVTADDCAGMDGVWRVLLGVQVVVAEEDATAARECLEELRRTAAESVDEEGLPLGKTPFWRRRPLFWGVALAVVAAEALVVIWLALDPSLFQW